MALLALSNKQMNHTPQDIINENLERRKALAARANAYDPITGEGCTGDRVRISYAGGTHYVPKEMPIDPTHPLRHRPNYDFEYWLSTINIRPTTLQRNIIAQIEVARKSGYGRFIIFHSAGNEITSLLKLYIRWLEFWRTPGANSLIMCPNTQEAKAMRQEIKDIAKYTPAELNLPQKALKYSSPTLIYCRKLAKYTHIRTHYSKRSYHTGIPYHYALITDASKCSYADDYKRAEEPSHLEVACRLIPSTIGGMFIVESGNRSIKNKKKYFYELWDHAENNRVSYTPMFHCWHESNANVLPINGSYTDFIFSMDDYEWHLWRDQKLTLEQINWYRIETWDLTPAERAQYYFSDYEEARQWLPANFAPINHQIQFAEAKEEAESAKPRGILHTAQEYNEEEWQELPSKWSHFLKEECCEAQIKESELNAIQAMLKQCAARSEASAPTDSTPNAPPGE